jgi:hypothetical protein
VYGGVELAAHHSRPCKNGIDSVEFHWIKSPLLAQATKVQTAQKKRTIWPRVVSFFITYETPANITAATFPLQKGIYYVGRTACRARRLRRISPDVEPSIWLFGRRSGRHTHALEL